MTTSPSPGFEAGQKVKVAGISIGKGFQGGIKRHNFSRGPVSHGSHNVRAPGSIGASAFPARVFKGMRMPGQMGNKRAHPEGPRNRRHRRRAQPAADQRLGSRLAQLDRRGEDRCLKRPCSARSTKADLPKELFAEPFHQSLVHEAARADLASRRRGTASTLTRGEVAFTTAKAWRQKGTGRARVGALGVSSRYGGGVTFGPKPRHYTVKVNRKARRRAMRSALSVHAERDSVAVLDAADLRDPVDQAGRRGAGQMGRQEPDPGRPHRRGDRGDEELPQHPAHPRARGRRHRRRRRDRRRRAGRLRDAR